MVSRRAFLASGAAAGTGLALGLWMPGCRGRSVEESGVWRPDALLAVDPSGRVTVVMGRTEMGQGISTVVPMIVADELDVAWEAITVEQADADAERYGDQTTSGSTSVRDAWETVREAAATARAMLVAAAAAGWGVSPAECLTRQGEVLHPVTERSIPYGRLVEPASRRPLPRKLIYRGPSRYAHLGRPRGRRDAPGLVTGEAVFGMDVRLPGMLTAVLSRPPDLDGSIRSFDATAALALPGVERVIQVGRAVAVVGIDTWRALKGREVLRVSWEAGPHRELDSERIEREWRQAAAGDGVRAWEAGDVEAAFRVAEKVIEAEYAVPFLAPAPMEPSSCTARIAGGRCEVWAPTQAPHRARQAAAEAAGLSLERVTLHVTPMGGGFGRGLSPGVVAEAVALSREAGVPVKVILTREDDLRHGAFMPGGLHLLRAGLDGAGRVMAWTHRVVTPSIGAQTGMVPAGSLDESAVGGARGIPYAIPNLWIDYVMPATAIPLGCMRSGYHAQNAFAVECFMDEVARAAGEDPYILRRRLLRGAPRHLGTLDLAAGMVGWEMMPPPGRARGMAVHSRAGSCVAAAAEVSAGPGGRITLHRVVSVIDCGQPLNPLGIRAQVEGGTVFALSSALHGEITFAGGRVVQGGFDDYRILSIGESPVIETHIVASEGEPSGAGEPPVPPVAPAVANAVAAATGRRIRRLPLSR